MKKPLIVISILLTFLSSCVVIRPGQAGVKQKIGKLSSEVYVEKAVWYNPFITKVVLVSTQTNNLELSLSLPSKEGLSITSQISILYHVDKERIVDIVRNLGSDYDQIIINVFRSASADVCSKYNAKDMHSGKRSEIENGIKLRMAETLSKQGILIDEVLMKSIKLPPGLASSVEQKLQAEQDVLRMQFVLEQEKLEAERKIIQAQGESDAQKILSEGLTEQIIEVKTIEAFSEIAKSNNAKLIITNGTSPLLLNNTDVQSTKTTD